MSAIITYTANPAIDVWAQCDKVVVTEKTRIRDVRYDPGGGGINVARVLVTLGVPALPVYLAGGATGPLFETLLQRVLAHGLKIDIEGDTRLSQVIYDRMTGKEYRFVPEGPQISAVEAETVLQTVSDLAGRHKAGDWFVVSGSMPRGLPVHHYLDLAERMQAKGLRFALDCSGPALRKTCEAADIDLLKVSKGELAEITHHALTSRGAIESAAQDLVATGRIKQVLVSLGPDGAILAHKGGIISASAIPVDVKSTVGAGDSFLAGFLYGLDQKAGLETALQLAIKAGSTACLNPGTQLVDKAAFERMGV
jgi:6-phosphofructokinase 2